MKVYVKRNTESIFGMARIGWVPPTEDKKVEVYVNTNDGGNTPHFHVRKYSGKHQFEWDVCIKYETAEYFKHGKYKDELPNKKIAKELDQMLRQVDKTSRGGYTFWEIAIDEWNRNNSDRCIDINSVQPDYTKL